MKLEIITPERIVFDAEVTSVAVPSTDGEFQVLDNHADIIATLVDGKVKISSNGLNEEATKILSKSATDSRFEYTIKGGVFQFTDNKAVILAD